MRNAVPVRILAALVVVAGLANRLSASEPQGTPHWIWASSTAEPAGAVRVVKRFQVGDGVASANIRLAADFCDVQVLINGRPALAIEPYCQAATVDVKSWLKRGENEITAVAKSVPGPAALALRLTIDSAAGRQFVDSDPSWQSVDSQSAVQSLGAVAPQLWGVGRRSADIDAFDNYEQWRQATGDAPATEPATFWVAPGFEVALVRTAQPDEGSWVSMAFDPQGRLTIAREDQGLIRLTLDEQRRSASQVETIDTTLLECRGLLYAHGALYANANNSKGLYRLTDDDGDGRFDRKELLREFPGGVGHGRNDLALGPDGMIYSIHGDSVDVPTADVLDRTSPLREARRGKKTSEGVLLRTDRDGKEWELVCGGLRNPFGVALNAVGDAFTYDADAEFDMGTPWYRPTRVVQLASGADYAWRGVTGRWPPYFPDHAARAVATLDIGKGSPTAVAFAAGSKFPPPYHDALFILDWAYGRVLAVYLAPRGAGYRAGAETFLKGRPLNVTDLAFGPDGAMYLITGGRKTQSALYRVSFVGAAAGDARPTRHELDCRQHAASARKLRTQLEALHGRSDPAALDLAWPHLDHADPHIRFAARIAVEHQPVATWRDRVLSEKRRTTQLVAMTSLVASGQQDIARGVVDRLLDMRLADLTTTERHSVLHLYGELHQAAAAAVTPRSEQIQTQLLECLNPVDQEPLTVGPLGTSQDVRRACILLLAELGSRRAVSSARPMLMSDDQADRLMGLLALRNVKEGWTAQARQQYFESLSGASRFVGGEGLPKFLANLRSESVATLTGDERRQWAELIEPRVAAEPDLVLPQRPIVKEWNLDDLTPHLGDSTRRGDADRGASVFRDALCARCHRFGTSGPAVGPDLTHVAARFSRRDLLQSILAPAAVVAENYRNMLVVMKDGRSLTGRVLAEGDYRSQSLRLATNPLRPSEVVEINKQDIERSKTSDTSPMPAHLLDTFDAQAVLDLLAFLEAGAPPPASSIK